MTRLVWFAGWVGVAIWSLFAAAAYLMIDVIGGAAMRNADMFSTDPQTVEQIFVALSWLHNLSTSAVLVVWGFVSLAILAVPWLIDRAVGRRAAPATARPGSDGVIDLAPGDYSIGRPTPIDRSTDPSRTGRVVPRIPPR